jgi:DNA-binding beta-propeller fold protein YncE
VLVLDTTTGRRLDAVVAGNQTTGLDVSPDGRLLAYTDFLDNRLVVMAVPPTATFTAGSGGRSERARIELVKTAPARR